MRELSDYGKTFSVALCILMVLLLEGCVTNQQEGSNESESACSIQGCADTEGVEKVEIYHFHGTHQCYSCLTVGKYAEETVNSYFQEEINSGKLVFAHVNAELPENAALAEKYGVTGSSLWIGVYNQTGFYVEQNVNVWYKIGNESDYKQYLKGVIESKLRGE